nr:sulfurtransferase [Demequina sp. NBRC 110057]
MPLVSVAELREELGDAYAGAHGGAVRLLDVRWSLARPDGRPAYLESHLPGAVYVDLDADLAAHGEPEDGRHPLPDHGALQAAARRWGLNDGDTVVVYDDGPSLAAARAWWLLRHAGVDARILDGGLAAWVADGGPVESGGVEVEPGTMALAWGLMPVVDLAEAATWPGHGILMDARAPERFRGESEPIDPRAGHIPGAVNVPTAGNVGADGRFLAREELAARFADAGVGHDSEVAVYCGSGVTAAHEIAALEVAGVRAALYPGSWSQWSNTPGTEVATG